MTRPDVSPPFSDRAYWTRYIRERLISHHSYTRVGDRLLSPQFEEWFDQIRARLIEGGAAVVPNHHVVGLGIMAEYNRRRAAGEMSDLTPHERGDFLVACLAEAFGGGEP